MRSWRRAMNPRTGARASPFGETTPLEWQVSDYTSTCFLSSSILKYRNTSFCFVHRAGIRREFSSSLLCLQKQEGIHAFVGAGSLVKESYGMSTQNKCLTLQGREAMRMESIFKILHLLGPFLVLTIKYHQEVVPKPLRFNAKVS